MGDGWMVMVRYFTNFQKCWNSSCAGFSYLKCKACRKARYCNIACRLQDFEEHRKVCDSLAKDYMVESEIPMKRVEELI